MITEKHINAQEISTNSISYYRDSVENEFNIKKYIISQYGYCPCFLYFDDSFSEDLFHFLVKDGKLINSSISGDVETFVGNKNISDLRGGWYIFRYDDIFIKISFKSEGYDEDLPGFLFENTEKNETKESTPKKRLYNISVYYPSSNNKVKAFITKIKQYVVKEENESQIFLFIKNNYGDYGFEPLAVDLPENLDLEINYGKDFLDIDKKIKERLSGKRSGLYMFHGPPGTGKTTYIKYLASVIKRDFIYIPTTMIEYFTTDPNSLNIILKKPNSVIILEDAEKAILKRQGDGMDSSAVSSLLNLSDGILSDILKTSVIVTYNCPKQDIDDALKRKGRLQMEYEFDVLSVEDAVKLAKKLKYPKKFIDEKITESISLSDVYNLEKEVEFFKPSKKKDTKRIIGFGNP